MNSVVSWVDKFLEVKKEGLTCFKIVPDKSINNYSNYKFFKDISELERTRGKAIRVKKGGEGFKILIQPATDYVWFEIIMKGNEIGFYVTCYSLNAEYVKLKLEQTFPHASIDSVDIEETKVPENNTLIAELKLQRHNFFSIRNDYTEQAQPIEDILACSEDVREGDVLKLSVRAQPFDQNYWSYKAEEWYKMTQKGRAPRRLRVTKNSIIGGLFGLSDFLFHKLGDLFREIHNVAFKNQKTGQITVDHSSQESREVGEISRNTRYKMTAPVFRTSIRVASHSENDTRRIMNLKSLCNAFVDLKDTNNSITRSYVHVDGSKLFNLVKKEINDKEITAISRIEVDYNIMCDRELGKLFQLPTAGIQEKYKKKLTSIGRTEKGIPDVFLTGKGIFLGRAEHKGEEYEIHIPIKNVDEFVMPMVVSGVMGSGKDVLATNWVVENALNGNGSVIPDVVDEVGRGMSDAIIRSLPPEKLIVLDFANENYVPYLDWYEGMMSENRFSQNRIATELVKFFEAEEEAGVQTERYLREAAKALPRGNVLEMGLIFISKEFRKKVIQDCKKRGDISTATFWEIYEKENEGRQRQISAPVLNRLHKLIGDPTLKPIFAQKPTGKIRFDKWLAEGKVIICKIPKVAFGTSGIRTLVHWITVKTWLAKQAMLFDGRKCISWLVLNEPHQTMDKGLAETLKEIYPESRKFGLGVMALFHDFAQIPRDLSDIMISSGSNFILLKQRGDKTWKKFLHRIEPTYTLEDCLQLNMYESMIGFLLDRKDQPIVRVKMNNMPFKRGLKEYNNTSHVQSLIRELGKPIEEVEREVYENEMLLLTSGKKSKNRL